MCNHRLQLEYQRVELLRERQQFHIEQLRAAEYRAKQLAAHDLSASQLPLPPQGQVPVPQPPPPPAPATPTPPDTAPKTDQGMT